MKSLRLNALVLTLVLGALGSARAGLVAVPLDGLVNANLRSFSAALNYPIAPTTLDVGGVPFELAPLDAVPDSLGIIFTPAGDSLFTIPADIFGATTVYTLINSAFGASGAVNGRIEVVGTGGAFASFDLTQGFNIRDHYQNVFNNVVTDPTIVTANFNGGVRLDRQTFVLPAAFATETLTEIRLVGTNGGVPQGQAFLAAATVGTASAVPEPGTLVSAAVGVGLFVLRRLRRRASGMSAAV